MDKYAKALSGISGYVRDNDFKGYDPYDVLKSPIPFQWLGKWGPVLAIQFMKRFPLNTRPLLGVPKGENPKGLGLLLNAYSQMPELDRPLLKRLFDHLLDLRTTEAKGYAWGYDFPWASPVKFLPAWSPTIVVTGFIAQGVHAYYQATNDPKALEVLDGISEFMLDLPRSENDQGICFSYSTKMQDVCFNASMLGAEHFARMYAINGNEQFKQLALKASEFTISHQYENGSWPYSLSAKGEARQQIDFHQGFVVCSLMEVTSHLNGTPDHFRSSIIRGAEFYRDQQFTKAGRSLWRWPKMWPTDIHHQAQGIITFARMAQWHPSFLSHTTEIADWTIDHMQSKDGSFYYRVHPLWKDRTRYMRWGQAWMVLALAELNKAREAYQ